MSVELTREQMAALANHLRVVADGVDRVLESERFDVLSFPDESMTAGLARLLDVLD